MFQSFGFISFSISLPSTLTLFRLFISVTVESSGYIFPPKACFPRDWRIMTNWLRWLWYHRNYFIIAFTPLAFLALPLAVPTPVSWWESMCLCVCASFVLIRVIHANATASARQMLFLKGVGKRPVQWICQFSIVLRFFFCNHAGKTPTWEHLKTKCGIGAMALWLGLILFMFDKLSTCDIIYIKRIFSVQSLLGCFYKKAASSFTATSTKVSRG